jgi:hypothetical protein
VNPGGPLLPNAIPHPRLIRKTAVDPTSQAQELGSAIWRNLPADYIGRTFQAELYCKFLKILFSQREFGVCLSLKFLNWKRHKNNNLQKSR